MADKAYEEILNVVAQMKAKVEEAKKRGQENPASESAEIKASLKKMGQEIVSLRQKVETPRRKMEFPYVGLSKGLPKELFSFNDDVYIVSKLLGRDPRDLRIWKESQEGTSELRKAMDSLTAGAGLEWIQKCPLWDNKAEALQGIRVTPSKQVISLPKKRREFCLAYCAGFFDAEGNIYIGKISKHAFSLWVQISQKNRKVLDFLRGNLGGKIYENAKAEYILSFYGTQARKALQRIFPYLIQKREEAQIAMEFQAFREENLGKTLGSNQFGSRNSKISEAQKSFAERLERAGKERLAAVETELPQIYCQGRSKKIFAYCAGFLDGDGSITPKRRESKNVPNYTILVRLSESQEAMPRLFQKLFGGWVFQGSRSDRVFACEALQAKELLKKTSPFLILKKRQADLAISLLNHISLWSRKMSGNNWRFPKLSKEKVNKIIAFRERKRQQILAANQATVRS